MVYYLFCFAWGRCFVLFKFYPLREKPCNLVVVFGTDKCIEISYREKDGRLKVSFIIGVPILEGEMTEGQNTHEALCTTAGSLAKEMFSRLRQF